MSLYYLVGLGGRERYREHALATAAVINAIGPDDRAPAHPLRAGGHARSGTSAGAGDFVEAGPREALLEVRLFCWSTIEVPVLLVSDHITNYLPLRGRLPDDRARLLAAIDRTLGRVTTCRGLRPAHFDHL